MSSVAVLSKDYWYTWVTPETDQYERIQSAEFDRFPELRTLFANEDASGFKFFACGTPSDGLIHVSRLSFPMQDRPCFFVSDILESGQSITSEDLTNAYGDISKFFSIESQFKIGKKTPSVAAIQYAAILRFMYFEGYKGIFFHANRLTEKSLQRCGIEIHPLLHDKNISTPGVSDFDAKYTPSALTYPSNIESFVALTEERSEELLKIPENN